MPASICIVPNHTAAELLRVFVCTDGEVLIERLPIVAWRIEDAESDMPECLPITFEELSSNGVEFIVSHGRYYQSGDQSFDTEDAAIKAAQEDIAARAQ